MKPLTFPIRLVSRCVVATLFVATISGSCNAAPQQMLGKSIVLRATSTYIIEKPNGTAYPDHHTSEAVIYISTLGRVFIRKQLQTATSVDRRSKTTERSPDEAKDIHWNGNDLVSSRTVDGVQFVQTISFDAGFQTCQVSSQYKVVGTFRDRLNGEPRRLRSMTLDSYSCTIQEGNPFAN
jgi:hypothetical protein